jgi:hypothetical protein
LSGYPVVLTDLLPSARPGWTTSSLRIPFSALGTAHNRGSKTVLYAHTPGALVDLAADLGYALNAPVVSTRPAIDGVNPDDDELAPLGAERRLVLNADPLPHTAVSGITGMSELSAINRAVGMLIERGHTPDSAHRTLRDRATAAGVDPHVYAAQLLRRRPRQ